MAGGIVYQLKGSTIEVLTGFDADSPSSPVVGISKANPAVVTETAHGRADGDIVQINGVVGMTDINGGTYVINVLTSNTYQLLGVDSTGYDTYTSGGLVDAAAFSNFCNLTSYQREGGISAEIDTTVLCSESKETIVGDPDFGITTIGYMFAPLTNVQAAIQASYIDGTPFAVRVTLPGSGGILVQQGSVQKTGESATLEDAVWRGSFVMRNSGPRYDFAAA